MEKTLTKSKTFWFNLVAVIAGGLGGIMGTEVISSNPEFVGYFTAAIGLCNIILRVFTTKPIQS